MVPKKEMDGNWRKTSVSSTASADDLEGDMEGGCKSPFGSRRLSSVEGTAGTGSPDLKKPSYELEMDAATIARRQKQIEYGKNTPEYINYVKAIPK